MDYQKQAKNFLVSCDATMKILYLETTINTLWNELARRDKYYVSIITPKGNMSFFFWDSIGNTYKKNIKSKEWERPNEYNVLSCLQKNDVGDLDNFADEFGYSPVSKRSLKRIIALHAAVVKEYNDLCRIFTPKQIEMLREIT